MHPGYTENIGLSDKFVCSCLFLIFINTFQKSDASDGSRYEATASAGTIPSWIGADPRG